MGHMAKGEDVGLGEDPEPQSTPSRTFCSVFVTVSLSAVFCLHGSGLCHIDIGDFWWPTVLRPQRLGTLPISVLSGLLILGVLGRWATGCNLKHEPLPCPSLLSSCAPGHPLLASPHITAASRLELPHPEVLTSGLS